MTEILTAAQMRAIEHIAIESGEVTGLELMERAGKGVVDAVFMQWPELSETSRRAVVLCGPGNNGGDGFVIARMLKAHGWDVRVYLLGDASKLPPDATTNFLRWQALGDVETIGDAPRLAGEADLYVDALFGTGLGRALDGAVLDWVRDRAAAKDVGAKTVAVDIPSGLCSDSGRVLGAGADVVSAQLTVSFHTAKIGHYLNVGSTTCGTLVVADIGLTSQSHDGFVDIVEGARLPSLSKSDHGHKFSNGHALVLSGGANRTGAARLAAGGALRVGAGLVTLGVPHEARAEVAAQITAVMMREIDDVVALDQMLDDPRVSALCVGPGFGLGSTQADMVRAILARKCATVLDADALTLVAQMPDMIERLHERCVLTPHAGEFARLFPDIALALERAPTSGPAYSKVDATRDAAARAGCVVLFKGPDTVIASPEGQCSVNAAVYASAAPWLATAGSGDVLAGFVTGLMARGHAAKPAAEAGAWLHAECARVFGPGMIAEDIAEQVPAVFRAIGVR